MLPQSYEFPAAVVLLLAGAVACFAGYRLFRIVLATFGFILGAMLTSSLMGISNTAGMAFAALVGGLAGAVIFLFAYWFGIALVGAGVGALIAHFGWDLVRTGDPPVLAVIILAILGATGAMFVQRHVIIVTTAFVGAWTFIVGILATVGDRGALAAKSASNVWILYPTTVPGYGWIPFVWVALALAGTAVQLGFKGKRG
jgi:Domain of unknown function (DUF4203)